MRFLRNLTFYEFEPKHLLIHSESLEKLGIPTNNTVSSQNLVEVITIVIYALDNGEQGKYPTLKYCSKLSKMEIFSYSDSRLYEVLSLITLVSLADKDLKCVYKMACLQEDQ